MLPVFRQLRRLELHKRSGRYFVYALGEIVLIVVGILIALQLNNWNEDHKARAQEKILLAEIHEEFLYNRAEWEANVSRYRELRAELDALVESFPLDLETTDWDVLGQTLSAAHRKDDYDASTTTLEALKSVSFDILSSDELRSLLLQWEVLLKDFEGVENYAFKFLQEQYVPRLDERLKRPYHFGLKDPRSDMSFLTTIEFENLILQRRSTVQAIINRVTHSDDPTQNIVKVMDRIIELTEPSQ